MHNHLHSVFKEITGLGYCLSCYDLDLRHISLQHSVSKSLHSLYKFVRVTYYLKKELQQPIPPHLVLHPSSSSLPVFFQ